MHAVRSASSSTRSYMYYEIECVRGSQVRAPRAFVEINGDLYRPQEISACADRAHAHAMQCSQEASSALKKLQVKLSSQTCGHNGTRACLVLNSF